MIVTPRIALRIAILVLLAVVLQVSFFSQLSLLGTTPDVVSVVVVSLGLLGGAVVGAVCGFATGLLLDSALLETLGVSSLMLLAVGYLAGRYREGFEVSNALTPLLLAGALTALGAAVFAAIQLMLGVETPVSLLVVREILIKGLLAAFLAVPVYPLLRRVLRPALVDDAPARHRVLSPARLRSRRRRGSRARLSGAVPPRRVRGGTV
jgi:rod shape-determining protein MreD